MKAIIRKWGFWATYPRPHFPKNDHFLENRSPRSPKMTFSPEIEIMVSNSADIPKIEAHVRREIEAHVRRKWPFSSKLEIMVSNSR